jgi:transposase-like protein
MDCPRCQSSHHCKAGIVNGRQRYRCNACHYHYTVLQKSDVKSQDMHRMALEMYLEGVGFRSIGRLLRISYGTVYQWIRQYGRKASLPIKTPSIPFVELDEIHSYVGQKKTTAGRGLLLIDLESGFSLLSAATAPQKRV